MKLTGWFVNKKRPRALHGRMHCCPCDGTGRTDEIDTREESVGARHDGDAQDGLRAQPTQILVVPALVMRCLTCQ